MLYKHSGKPVGGVMNARWSEALWLGKSLTTGEHIVWALEHKNVTQARDVHERDAPLTAQDVHGITAYPTDAKISGVLRAPGPTMLGEEPPAPTLPPHEVGSRRVGEDGAGR